MDMRKSLNKIKIFFVKHHLFCLGGIGFVLVFAFIWHIAMAPNTKIAEAQQNMFALTENIRNFYKKRPDYWGLSTQSALKNGLIPQMMLKDSKIYSAVGQNILIGSDEAGSVVMPGMRSFYIIYNGVSKKDCVDMVSYPISEQNKLGLLGVIIKNNKEEVVFQWGGENSLPIKKDKATKICRNKSIILWNFE